MADETMLTFIREMMGYTDAQWETWKSNPQNLKMAGNLMDVLKYKVVAEVTFSSGCGAGHKVGDRIVFGGDGTLLCKENPIGYVSGCSLPSTRSSGGSWTRSATGRIRPRWPSTRSTASMSGWTTAVGVRL